MKIKVTAGELTVMARPLQELMAAKMPSGAGYQVARLARGLGQEIQLVLQRQAEIMRKYNANETKDGGLTLSMDSPDFAMARVEITDLLAQEITVDVDIATIPQTVIIEPSTLLLLEKFIKVAE